MKRKIIYSLFILCLIKLYHIADRSLHFSPNLLFSSFTQNAGEKRSLGVTFNDLAPIRDFFIDKKITKFSVSNEIKNNHPEIFYLRLLQFNYPAKLNNDASIRIKLKREKSKNNCKLLYFTENFNIHECK